MLDGMMRREARRSRGVTRKAESRAGVALRRETAVIAVIVPRMSTRAAIMRFLWRTGIHDLAVTVVVNAGSSVGALARIVRENRQRIRHETGTPAFHHTPFFDAVAVR